MTFISRTDFHSIIPFQCSMMQSLWTKLFRLNTDLENLLWNVFWMMRGLTVNVDSHSDFKPGIIQISICLMCMGSYIFYYPFGSVYNVYWGDQAGDVFVISNIVSLAFASFISAVKAFSVLILRHSIKDVIDKYRAFDATLTPHSRYYVAVLRTLKVVKTRALIFWCGFCTTSVIYSLLPGIMPGYDLPENGLKPFGLQPVTQSPNYEIAYTISVLAAIFATTGISNVTVLLIVLSGYMEAHLLALAEQVECVLSDAKQKKENSKGVKNRSDLYNYRASKREINSQINVLLIDIIEKHIRVLDCHKIVKGLFNEVIALEFLFTTIAMCTMLLGNIEETYLQIPYTISQLVVDTILGQRLIDSSKAFEAAVYRCGWENFDKSNMKSLQILLQSSQKTITLTAGNITCLSYICFASIVRFVYSSYATLRQSIENK